MYLSFKEELLIQLQKHSQTANSGELWGLSRDNQTVLSIQNVEPQPNLQLVGSWIKTGSSFPQSQLRGDLLAVFDNGTNSVEFYISDAAQVWQCQLGEKISSGAFEARLQGVFSPQVLAHKRVIVIGLGSGGSVIAFELARAGVSDFILIDFDRLETSNITRHICGLNDIGRYKTLAVRDYLYNSNPAVKVETYEFDVTTNLEKLEILIAGADLVVGATDSEAAKNLINEVAWQAGVAAVYGAAYDLGTGGDIFLAQPSEGACYNCFRLSTEELFAAPTDAAGIDDYGLLVDNKPISQPAIGLDVRMVGLITARVGLAWLLRDDSASSIKPFPSNWILWGNQVRPGWIFERPLQSEYIQIEKLEDCPICNPEEYTRRNLGLSVVEALDVSKSILQSIPTLDSLK